MLLLVLQVLSQAVIGEHILDHQLPAQAAHMSTGRSMVPLGLKDIRVVIANLQYPTHVITVAGQDINNPSSRMLSVEEVSRERLERQLFQLIGTMRKGIGIKNNGARSYPFRDKIKIGSFVDSNKAQPIYLKKDRSVYPHTFRLIADDRCLSVVKNYAREDVFVPKFVACTKTNDQLWGVFTSTKANAFLNGIKHYTDEDQETIWRLVDRLHEQGRDVLEE